MKNTENADMPKSAMLYWPFAPRRPSGNVGNLYEEGSDRHFPIVARLDKRYRENLPTIQNITVGVTGQNGTSYIPLTELASIKMTSGAFYIYREQQERYLPIKFSVRGRDLGGAVAEAQRRVSQEVVLPSGYHLAWVGEFGNLKDAIARLEIVVPISILFIGLLLYLNFESVKNTLIAMSVIPMALIGGIRAIISLLLIAKQAVKVCFQPERHRHCGKLWKVSGARSAACLVMMRRS